MARMGKATRDKVSKLASDKDTGLLGGPATALTALPIEIVCQQPWLLAPCES